MRKTSVYSCSPPNVSNRNTCWPSTGFCLGPGCAVITTTRATTYTVATSATDRFMRPSITERVESCGTRPPQPSLVQESALTPYSERFHIFNELAFLFGRQLEFQVVVIVVDDRLERWEPSVVIEAALVNLLRVEQGPQRRGDIAPVRAPVGLETV